MELIWRANDIVGVRERSGGGGVVVVSYWRRQRWSTGDGREGRVGRGGEDDVVVVVVVVV